MVNVAVVGAAGRMGKILIEACFERDDAQLSVATEHPDSSLIGADAGEVAGVGKNGVIIAASLDDAANDFDVLIDFTRPEPTLTIIDWCPSLGFPIPYDVQLTNPLKISSRYGESGVAAIEQPEPSGLYSSKNTSATWIRRLIKMGGKTVCVPVYVESKVECYPYPIKVDKKTGLVTPIGAPTITNSDRRQ